MIKIDRALVSLDVIEEHFTCDTEKCKGACCVEGQSGAPITEGEIKILEKIYPVVKGYMQEKGIATIEKQGVFVVDADDEYVTPLIDNKECAFAVFNEKGIAQCSIEKAYKDGKISFQKPVSCHLYPVRIRKFKEYEAVNYDKWHICKPAIHLGEKLNSAVHSFVKDALIRKYGNQWYLSLVDISREYLAEKNKNSD